MEKNVSLSKIVFSSVGIIIMLAVLIFSGKIFENVDANEIVAIQDPIDGELHWYVVQGLKWQGAGKVTSYQKRLIYEFSCGEMQKEKDECVPEKDHGIKVRFNDGGHGTMYGSIQYEMPLDEKNLTALHTRFGSQEAIQKQLIETVVNKSIYMTGPLMSSRESFAEKRNDLIRFVEDQVSGGVYRTTSKEVRTKDSITGADKTITVVEVVMKDGIPDRQEEAVLSSFGIRAFNFSISRLPYDGDVEKQIKQQQQITMDVQTAIADAKKAEQRAITVAEQGKADAAKAKWDQEVIKAQMVTEAEQKKEVAKLDKEAAEFTKQKEILLGQGESERKRLIMSADGALEKKLATYEAVMGRFAQEFAKQKWVPEFQMNGGGSGAEKGNAAAALIDLLTAKTAKDLGVDMEMKKR